MLRIFDNIRSTLTSFVEDRLATLKNVIKEPELDGWNLYLGKILPLPLSNTLFNLSIISLYGLHCGTHSLRLLIWDELDQGIGVTIHRRRGRRQLQFPGFGSLSFLTSVTSWSSFFSYCSSSYSLSSYECINSFKMQTTNFVIRDLES